ncbi:MAG TPA: TIGR03118 family protein, partial [Pirellulales bacterium]|nr:TIGR03118 family protein [Pirellulales bacterium]
MARRRRAQRTNASRRPSATGRQAQRSFRLERLEERQLLTASGYQQVNLVSDQAGTALVVDPNLVNPYGIALAPGSGDAWVANAGSDTISRYIGAVGGSPFKIDSPALANMPGSLTGPTGIVSNSTGDFVVQTPGGGTGSASFIFSSENGQLAVAPTLNTDTATAGNNPASGAFYTGLALVTVNSHNYLYAADFAQHKVSVFDNHFQLSSPLVSGAFQDPNLPTGYSPYNVQVLSVGGTPLVFVSYAKQDTNDPTKIASDSQGLIDVYGLDGTFQTKLVTTTVDSQISAPWGMAIAPATFGDFANDLLVANRDGTIHAYSLTTNASAAPTAAYSGTLSDSSGTPITIDGLHGLAFGNNASVGNASTLFFSAGGSDGTHGLFGELINAFDNPLTAQGTSFTATEATSFNGIVAAFTPEAARAGDAFTATIDWGDGSSTSTGTLTSNGSGGFLVSGTHTYNTAGDIASIAVSIVDTTTAGATASLSSTALVIEGNLSATSTAVAATEGTALSNVPVVTFTDPSAGVTKDSYTATIDWGDGTTTSAGSITGSNGTFTVSGSHTYAQQGTETFTVSISEGVATPTPITVTGTATVADADTLSVTASPISTTEGSTFSGNVATFTDTYTVTPKESFTATIDWGDGTSTSTGQITGSNGTFTISGSHVYATQGSPTFSVTISENGGTANATDTATATVADGDVLTATGLTLATTAGVTFSGQVATFTDTITSTTAGDLTATIDWGDGTTTDVGVITGSDGSFTVSGSHVYTSPGGPEQVTVILGENAPGTASATAHSTALIFDPDLTGASATFSGTEATAIATDTTVATFTDSNLSATQNDFTASINWGDSTPTTTGVVTGSNGTFTVSGGHTYADDGNYSVTITLFETATGTSPALTIASAANIADAPLALNVPPLGATEGSVHSFTSLEIATFTDANPNSLSSDFTATIDWGDGTSSTGVITGGQGTFTIRGSHAYLDEGSMTLTVTLAENSSTGNTISATAAATIAEGDFFPTNTVATLSTTEGTTFSGAVATFIDQNTLATGSGFTAIIDWGDGTTLAGSVTGTNGTLTVSGTHLYADDGYYAMKVTLVDTGGTNAQATGTATVNEDSGFAVTAASITGTEGSTFNGTVATFTDTGSTQASTHYTATIDWGDGTSSTTGVVSGSNGTFSVTGTHVYGDEGPFHPVVTIKEVNSPATISATGTATMADADALTATGVTFSPTRGVSFTGTVAKFTDTYTASTAGNFTATIDWGDGTSSTGTVTGSNGTFTVTGTHTYTQPGAEAVKVVIKDTDGTASATASSTATPISSTVSVTGSPVNVSTGVTVSSATVATFTDTATNLPTSDYTATIDWGDGTSSTGTITLSGSKFTVTGSHVYTEPKTWNVTITVKPAAGAAATASSQATVGSETERFVAQVYHDVLSRRGEMQGIEYWTNRINSGGSRTEEALNIEHSQEYRNNTIQGLYRLLLHRAADAASLTYFSNMLIDSYTSGADAVDQIAESLISSSEYYQNRGGGTASGFLNAVYSDLLYRSPDAATSAAWAAKNLADASVRAQAAASVFGSDEYMKQLLNFTQPHSTNAYADEVVHGF